MRAEAESLDERVNGRFRPALFLLAWAVGVVMLIVCANLSNLQLARMSSRQQELAIRIALGAGRRRVDPAAADGKPRAVRLRRAARSGARRGGHAHRLSSRRLQHPLADTGAARCRGLRLIVLIAVATGLIFGLMPALQVPASTVQATLKEHTRGASDGKRHAWIRGALVVSEVTLACVLLVGAGLLIRSLLRVLDVNLGFQAERVAELRIDPSAAYSDRARRNAYLRPGPGERERTQRGSAARR